MSRLSDDTIVDTSVSGEGGKKVTKDIFEHIATVTHTLVFGAVGFLIFLCFESEWVFFTWHPFLYTIGWVCLMTEAILVITPDNVFSKHVSFKLRVQYHWVVQALAVGCCTAGFFVDVINKNDGGRFHFQSWHGLIGLLAMIFCVPTCVNGFAALFSVDLKRFVRPSLNKLFHAVCGVATFVTGSAAMVLSLYTGWFESRTGKASQTVCFAVIAFATLWVLVRPIITSYGRIKSLVR